MRIDLNKNIVNQLLDLKPDKAASINTKFPLFEEWQNAERRPTINQVSDLADYFNVPFGYFFLEQIPTQEYPIRHYRTVNRGYFKPSDELLDTIKIIEERQKWASYTLIKMQHHPIEFANTVTIEHGIQDTAQIIRDILNLHENWAKYEGFTSWYDAFKFLVKRIEKVGVYVVVNGVVGNNTQRPLELNEFRGFVLYDEYAPFIFINGTDFISGKIFTLIHEFVHVLIGKSASFDFSDLQPANDVIEEFCDAVAAEFLVATNSLLDNFKKIGKDYKKLADTYKVSQIVIIRRLLDLNKISYNEFKDSLNNLKNYKTEKRPPSDGGDYFNNQPNRISDSFFNLLYSAAHQNKILYRDVFRLTGLTPEGFDKYVERYITKIN